MTMPGFKIPYTISSQLEVHHRLFIHELEMLTEHVDTVEHDFKRRRQTLKKYLEEEAEKLSEQEQAELGDIYVDEFYKLEELFPTLHRHAYLLIILGDFENYLNHLCNYTKYDRKSEIDISALKDRGIKRAATYLHKVLKIDVQSREWEEITLAQTIRNFIVHNGGQLTENSASKKVRDRAKRSSQVIISSRDKILLGEEFLPALLTDIHNFVKVLKAKMGQAIAK